MSRGHWTGQRERASAGGMRFLSALMRRIGPGPVKLLVVPVAFYYYLTSTSTRRYSRQYRQRLEAEMARKGDSAALPAWFGFRHVLAFAQSMVDRVHAWNAGSQGMEYRIEGLVQLDSVLERERPGALFLVCHHGNFDLSIARSDMVPGKRFHIVMNTSGSRIFNQFRDGLLQTERLRFLEPGEVDAAEAMVLAGAVDDGDIIVIAADRTGSADGANAIAVPFLGEQARFPIGPWVLAHALQVPVYLLFARVEGGACIVRFEHFAERVELPRGERQAAIQALMARYATRLEEECLAAPLDWFNFYDFWQVSEPDANPTG